MRFAALCHDLGKGTTRRDEWPRHIGHEGRSERLAAKVAERWKVPTDCRELALLVAREHTHVHQSSGFGPRPGCACWSAATPGAAPSALPSCCRPARPMPAAAPASRTATTPGRTPGADLAATLAIDQAAVMALLARGLKGRTWGGRSDWPA